MDFLSLDELEEMIDANPAGKLRIYTYSGENFLDNPASEQNGIPLWQYFLYLAILFLTIELILVNRK